MFAALLLLLLLHCASGCTSAPTVSGSKLALFPPRFRTRIKRDARRALHQHVSRLMAAASRYSVIPQAQLVKALSRRRGAQRRCSSFKCQARLAPKLFGAGRSLAIVLSRERRTCRTTGHLYDLPDRVTLASVFMRSGCAADELRVALEHVICKLAQVPPDEPAPKKKPVATKAPKSRADKKKRARRRRKRRRRAKRKKLEPAPLVEVADGSTPRCLARASYLWADRQFDAFAQHKYRGRPAVAEQRAAERLLALKRLYDSFTASALASVQVAALCRQGMLYDVYADRLSRGEIGRWRRSALARGRTSLAQRAAAFRKHGANYYRRCLDKARELGVEDALVKHARARVPAPPAR